MAFLPKAGIRFRRRQLLEMIDDLQRERDLAVGRARATRDALRAWLESTADAHDLDAKHAKTPETRKLVHRMVAADLRQAAIDVSDVR